MSQFDHKKFIEELLSDVFSEGGYAGQGHTSGAESFYGSYFGFGGTRQLAGKRLNPATQKIEDMEQAEIRQNAEDQQRVNGGYPIPRVFPGGDGNTGISNGTTVPNTIPQMANSAEELGALAAIADEEDVEEGEGEKELEEQSSAVAQGPQRGAASDGFYRNLPGFPRPNAIEKDVDFIPQDEKDIDGDGEEDVYLGDDEYVADVLRLNGLELKPDSIKRLLGVEKLSDLDECNLHERTLYHGTSNAYFDSIQKRGLTGELGDWVKDAYGPNVDIDPENWEEELGGVTFAADKSNINAAVGAMRFHVGKKLGKYLQDVTEDDLRQHGMLVIIRDVEEPEKVKYPEDIEDDTWYHRPKDDEDYYGAYPIAVEPGDWFTRGSGAIIDDVLVGNKMLQLVRRMGGLKHVESDKRRKLIKLMIAVHGPQRRQQILQQVKDMPEMELWSWLRKYEEEGEEILKKQRKEKYGKKEQDPQMSFDFSESTYKLSNVFREMYVSPGYDPEPDRSTPRYKRGKYLRDDEPDATKKNISHVDYTGGHTAMKPAEKSPGAQAYGQVGWPKDFVPEDWEQRNPKTQAEDDEKTMNEANLKEIIRQIVSEELKTFQSKKAQYTGLDDETGDGPAEGGSEAFEKNREEVIEYDKKHRPKGVEDLKNYHMDD
jgi:hypothetical protein